MKTAVTTKAYSSSAATGTSTDGTMRPAGNGTPSPTPTLPNGRQNSTPLYPLLGPLNSASDLARELSAITEAMRSERAAGRSFDPEFQIRLIREAWEFGACHERA